MPNTRSQTSRPAKLILVLPFTRATLDDPTPLLPIITRVFTEASSSDFLVLFSSPGPAQLYPHIRKQALSNWNPFQTFLAKVYACLAAAQWSSGNVLSHVEVAFDGEGEGSLKGYEDARVIGPRDLAPCLVKHDILPDKFDVQPDTYTAVEAEPAGYPVVALGGTFDHLHAAHKLLIHLALFICTRKLIVGVMVDSLLSGKSNADLVEPLSARLAAVEAFVSRRGGVIPDVVPISDAYGPTAYDDDIDALVVSQETASGGLAVNTKRNEASLRPLEIHTVEVIGSTSRDFTNLSPEELKDLKLGSTAIRQYIADQAPVGRNF